VPDGKHGLGTGDHSCGGEGYAKWAFDPVRERAGIARVPALLVWMTPFRATGTFPYFVPFSRNGYEHGTMYSPAPTISTPTRCTGTATPSSSIRGAPTSPRWHPCRVVTADMVPGDVVGIWLFHCHISFYSAGGMVGRYAVIP